MRTRPGSMTQSRFCGISVFKQLERSPQQGDGTCDTLRNGTQDPDARMAPRGVKPYVGEIGVERDGYSCLIAARIQNTRIGTTTEALLKYRLHFVTGITQQRNSVPRQVFIQLEASSHPLRLTAGIGIMRSRARSAA